MGLGGSVCAVLKLFSDQSLSSHVIKAWQVNCIVGP